MFWYSLVGADRPPKQAMSIVRQEYLGLCVLWPLSLLLQSVPRRKKSGIVCLEEEELIFWCSLIGADRPPKQAMPVAIACLEQEDLGFGVLCSEWKVIRAEKIADGRVPLPAKSGYISENRWIQFLGKIDVTGCTPPFFGHGRVEVGVDQSAVSVSRCKGVGTLLCRFLTRVYPVVSFTLLFKSLHVFGVFRFVKTLKILNKGEIHCISWSSRGTFIVCAGPHWST